METDLIQAVWQEIRAHLEAKKAHIYQQITSYPPPIPACDAQFNYLLETRAGIAEALNRLNALSRQPPAGGGDAAAVIHEFIASSVYLDDAAGRQIRAQVQERLAALES